MPTPASAAIVAMGTRGPSRCTARVAARTRAWWLRAASLRGSRELRMAAMRLLKLSLPPPARALHSNGRNPPDFAGLPPDLIRQPPPSKPQGGSMPSQPAPIPPDDPSRGLTVARPDEEQSLPHIGLVGDTYTILVTGHDTAGRYTLIDMHVPPGGGPPPHRHDFEEMFTLLEGEIELTFRGQRQKADAGFTVNIPANAPHAFKNQSDRPARLLCMCAPPGLEEFFLAVGIPVASRTAPAPEQSNE